jgi:MoxR-like ATPase
MAVKERIKTLLTQLNTGIYEKEEVMALALLSSIAGESIFLWGLQEWQKASSPGGLNMPIKTQKGMEG